MDLKVGDRVKVKDNDFTKQSPRNLAGRYGYVEVIRVLYPEDILVRFNDFSAWINSNHLQKCDVGIS